MRRRGVILTTALLLAACGGSTPTSSHSPATSPAAAASEAPSSSAAASPTSQTFAPLVQCTAAVPAGDNLAIGMVVGDPTVVVRDIQDPANAKNLCSFSANVISPEFANGGTVAYSTSDHQIVSAPLSGGLATLWATYSGGAMESGQFAFSPDGHSMTYLDGSTWHLVTSAGNNKVLTTLPQPAARGVNPDEDDSYLSFSPDGQYIALFQTFRVGGSGPTAADQVRRASDGGLVYATNGMTMAVWASVPSRLFFRDSSGNVHRWDPTNGLSSMTSIHWIRPKASPDGRWIAYTFRTAAGVGGVGFYSVQSNSVQNTTPPGRSGVMFLSNDLVWYAGEKPCTANCAPGSSTMPSGVTYIYSISGASEITSRLAAVYDAWPHQTAPGI